MLKTHYQEDENQVDLNVARREVFLKIALANIAKNPEQNLGGQIQEAFEIFASCVNTNREEAISFRALEQVRDFGKGHFLYGTNPDKEIQFFVENKRHKLVGQESFSMSIDNWFCSLFAAMITRDNEGIKQLCAVPQAAFLSATVTPNKFDIALIEMYKGLFDSKANVGQLIIETMEAFSDGNFEADRKDYILNIIIPSIRLHYYILTNELTDFNKELEEALVLHQNYWNTEERKGCHEGWVSLSILAACVVAMDSKKVKIEVQSDYTPEWLLYLYV